MRALMVVLWGVLAAVAWADTLDVDAFKTQIESQRQQVEGVASNLDNERTDLLDARERLRAIKLALQDSLAPVEAQLADARANLARLGPVPAEDQPPESADIQATRQLINTDIGTLDGLVRQSALLSAEIDSLESQIAARRRAAFTNNILTRSSIWEVDTVAVFNESLGVLNTLTQQVAKILSNGANRLIAAIFSLVIAIALWPISRSIVARTADALSVQWQPYSAIQASDVSRMLQRVARATIVLVATMIVALAISGLLPPMTPKEGLSPLSLVILTSLFASTLLSASARHQLFLPVALCTSLWLAKYWLTALSTPSADMLLALSVVAVATTAVFAFFYAKPIARVLCLRWLSVGVVRLVAILVVIVMLSGFVTLAEFLVTRAMALSILWVVHQAVCRTLDAALWRPTMASTTSLDLPIDSQFWIKLTGQSISVFLLMPWVLLLLGMEWEELRDGLYDLLFGFTIGGVEFSLVKVVSAIAVFVGLIWLTRRFKSVVEHRILPHAKVDEGVKNSLSTLLGYIGVVLAILFGISVLGVDLSNLAIIAGALSLGIGFGLQSIVNNFVSGLILLFERPIKVGDWIATASGEGIVKRISVRSTEIETFDRSSVIVPNSELISGAVTNMTHTNKLGRVTVPIGVSYDAEPEQVMQILREIIEAHPLVLQEPPPGVVFQDFGDSALLFEVKGFISDVGTGIGIKNELRLEIFKRLKAAGIGIPFPQMDVHISKP